MQINITIHDAEAIGNEKEFFRDVMARVAWQCSSEQDVKVDIYANPRVPDDAPEHRYPGWLEWLIRYTWAAGYSITVGAIQRTKTSSVEFHS